ncbi:MAG: peptide deformylase [Pseudomonadota bacterium]
MARLTIEVHPSDVLGRIAAPVETFDDALRTLAADMFETMYESSGIGLAAPQVGHSIRMVVLDLAAGTVEQGTQQLVLLNPEVTARRGDIMWEEGCLSLPGILGKVKRSNYVKVEALDLDGEGIEVEGHELVAVALQHEIDHLDGILFTQRVSPLQRKFLLREYARKQHEERFGPSDDSTEP